MFHRPFSGLGIDVSEHHIRFALVSSFGGVKKLHEIVLPEGLVVDEKIVKLNELKTLIVSEIQKNPWLTGSPIRTTILVPESRVFSSESMIDSRLDKKTAAIESARLAQKKIPMPFSQAYVSVTSGERVADKTRFNVYASQKEVVDGLRTIFDFPSFKPIAMEVNSKALQRFFVSSTKFKKRLSDKKTLIGIADIGHSWSTVSVFASRGSQLFSRTLAHSDFAERSDEKILLTTAGAEKIITTIKETQNYFIQYQAKISVVVLCGVEALQDNVLQICKKEKDIPFVLLGDSLQNQTIPKDLIHRFGASIGAAYRSIRPGVYSYQHNFLNTL